MERCSSSGAGQGDDGILLGWDGITVSKDNMSSVAEKRSWFVGNYNILQPSPINYFLMANNKM